MSFKLEPGQICPMKSVTTVYGVSKEETSFTYKAQKGRRMVFLFMGGESAEEPVSVAEMEKRMNALGWYRDESKD